MHLLLALADHVQRHPDALPADLTERIRRAQELVEQGCSLSRAMGADHRRRDSALRRAGELLLPDGGAWARAGAILEALRRFERRKREPATNAEAALAAALSCGCVPRTRERLYVLIKH